jgi:hypothetical protein
MVGWVTALRIYRRWCRWGNVRAKKKRSQKEVYLYFTNRAIILSKPLCTYANLNTWHDIAWR